jgi:hypothetical protein
MVDGDPWKAAAGRAERAERRPGLTPRRRGLAEIFVDPLTANIAAKLEGRAKISFRMLIA